MYDNELPNGNGIVPVARRGKMERHFGISRKPDFSLYAMVFCCARRSLGRREWCVISNYQNKSGNVCFAGCCVGTRDRRGGQNAKKNMMLQHFLPLLFPAYFEKSHTERRTREWQWHDKQSTTRQFLFWKRPSQTKTFDDEFIIGWTISPFEQTKCTNALIIYCTMLRQKGQFILSLSKQCHGAKIVDKGELCGAFSSMLGEIVSSFLFLYKKVEEKKNIAARLEDNNVGTKGNYMEKRKDVMFLELSRIVICPCVIITQRNFFPFGYSEPEHSFAAHLSLFTTFPCVACLLSIFSNSIISSRVAMIRYKNTYN